MNARELREQEGLAAEVEFAADLTDADRIRILRDLLRTADHRSINVIFNATYLFSSASLDVDNVCETVMAVKQSAHVRRLLFVYSNTTTEISGEKFRTFKRQLKGEFTSDGLIKCVREYHKWRGSEATSKIEFVRQLLVFEDDE
jgi:hypothetical protein